MASSPKKVFIFDMTRHRSHLLFRYLSTHPDIQPLWHPFLPAFLFGPENITHYMKDTRPISDQKDNEATDPDRTNTYAEVAQNFLARVQEAAVQGKILVANEHCQMVYKPEVSFAIIRNQTPTPAPSNPTVIPDHLFTNLTPVFVIRNPVFAVPSNYTALEQTSHYRPGDEGWKLATGMELQRRLFDLFKNRDSRPPLVVDGDDVVWRTEAVRDGLCQGVEIDPQALSETWEAVPEHQRPKEPIIRHFLHNIDESTGIERLSQTPPRPDLGKAYNKWIEKYGQEVANQLRLTVEENMSHYEYMRQFKV